MAPRTKLDIEWAESIIGLRLKVPDHWWKNCNGRDLYDGKIVSFDEAKQKWGFVCDSEPDEVPYPMAYEAVYKYVDKYASTWPSYTGAVTFHPIRGDGSDRVAVQQPGGVNHLFKLTPFPEWENIPLNDNGDPAGRIIDPIPWEGGDE